MTYFPRGLPKVGVFFEYSGVVRDAFIDAGCYAVSVDWLPTESPMGSISDSGNLIHYQGDVEDVLDCPNSWPEWDLIIAHPPCTYLTNSAAWAFTDGPYHQRVKPGTLVGAERRAAREQALRQIEKVWRAPCKRKCLENPAGCINTRLPFMPKPQRIQPHQFGADASKTTCLWLRGLPELEPTEQVPGRWVEYPPGSGKQVQRWANQTDSGQNRLTPSEARGKDRAKTYEGIAKAMAEQWAPILFETYQQ